VGKLFPVIETRSNGVLSIVAICSRPCRDPSKIAVDPEKYVLNVPIESRLPTSTVTLKPSSSSYSVP
jgi:hypothetical protein